MQNAYINQMSNHNSGTDLGATPVTLWRAPLLCQGARYAAGTSNENRVPRPTTDDISNLKLFSVASS